MEEQWIAIAGLAFSILLSAVGVGRRLGGIEQTLKTSGEAAVELRGRLTTEVKQLEGRLEHLDEAGSRHLAEISAAFDARLGEHAKQPGHAEATWKLARLETQVERLIRDVDRLAEKMRSNGHARGG